MESGRVAVVTGAGSGIGRSVALALLGHGYRVALAGRREDALRETAAQAEREAPAERGDGGADALVVPTDVTDDAAVADLFAAVGQRWGRVDVLFNNAGTFGPAGSVDTVPLDGWHDTVAVNLTGMFLCARHAVRLMKEQRPRGGRIINNGSISAQVPRPDSVAYTATKHAVTGLTRSLALDGRPHDIACGQIDIGNAATDMTAGIAESARQADGSTAPEATFDAAHVADAVLYMAGLPLSATVNSLTVTATAMPYVGRG